MMKKQMISLLSLLVSFAFLGGCMTPMQMVDLGKGLKSSIKMKSWSDKEQHYNKLMNEGKYDELVEECKIALENSEKGDALREARLFMIKSSKYKKPFYWAAFSLTGDYK